MSQALAVAYRLPLLGTLLREAIEGGPNTKVLFIINCLLIWMLSIAYFGYPAIIIPALAAVPVMFVILFLITWDGFDRG